MHGSKQTLLYFLFRMSHEYFLRETFLLFEMIRKTRTMSLLTSDLSVILLALHQNHPQSPSRQA